jgi:hypothetical protein
MKKYRVIVPSWSELSADMQVETGVKYPVFIRLGGIPLYAHILRLYEKIRLDAEFVFVLPGAAPDFQHGHVNGFDVSISRIEKSRSIADTVLSAVGDPEPGQAVVVHMADTLLAPATLDKMDAIYVQDRTDLYRWTSIRKEKTGSLSILLDREHRAAGVEQSVCVGVFAFSDGQYFVTRLAEAIGSGSERMDPFFSAVESYSRSYTVELLEPDYWYDCGHVDSFYESRLNFHNLRHFNSLSYDSLKGQVTKRSNNSEAFRHQVRWFKQVPDELACFLPRIYDSSDGELPFITMELLSIPTLGELFVNCRLELGAWNDVANKIKYIQGLLKKHAFKSSISEKIAHEIYIGKTRGRIQQFIEQCPDAAEMWVAAAGQRMSLAHVLSTLDDFAQRNRLLAPEALTPIHGDMCFSNVLYDARGRHIKLIDPRGEFGIPGIYGDPRYDKAKLMHSYSSGYDFIVSDHFDVGVDASGELLCSVEMDDYHHKVKQIFDATIFGSEHERCQCDAIQALLFLSMLPLHSDKPQRQLAMLHTGLHLYARNLLEGERA